MNYYISDTHFRHKNVLTFDDRPFKDVDEMENTIINNWNGVVRPEDTTYIVGDFCLNKNEAVWKEILRKITGSKVLILGNHDITSMSNGLKLEFQDIQHYKEVEDGRYRVILSHYPQLFYRSSWNPWNVMLYGHVHTTRENTFMDKYRNELIKTRSLTSDTFAQTYNVGCMLPEMGYTPRKLSEILNFHAEERMTAFKNCPAQTPELNEAFNVN